MKFVMSTLPTHYCHSINDEEIVAYTSAEFKQLMKYYKFKIMYHHKGDDAYYFEILEMIKKDQKDLDKNLVSIIA